MMTIFIFALLIIGFVLGILAIVVSILDKSASSLPYIKDERFFRMVNSGPRLDKNIKSIDLDNSYVINIEQFFVEA